MDELPREARALLALAEDAHDPPDDGARDRVRRGVIAAAALGGGAAALSSKTVASAAGGALKSSLFASTGAKMLLAGSALVVASAVTVVAPRMGERATQKRAPAAAARESAHTEREPVAAQVPTTVSEAVVPPVEASAPVQAQVPEKAPARAPRKLAHTSAPPALEAEMRLLTSASEALAAHRLGEAQKKLAEHRRLFPRGQLASEREGLLTLTHCTRGGKRAQKQARAFLKKQPEAVLSARIRSACKIDEEP